MTTDVSPRLQRTTDVASPATADDSFFRISVAQYHAMAGTGILTDGDPVELIEGLLLQKMTKHPPHTLATELTRETLDEVLPTGWFVNVQEPITTLDSEPEPDVTVVRGRRRDYSGRHPEPRDVGLVIEVAGDSIHRDRGRKKRAYARAAIPVYWIVNLIDRQIEVCTDPTGPAEEPDYRSQRDFPATESVPIVIDGQEVGRLKVADVLP